MSKKLFLIKRNGQLYPRTKETEDIIAKWKDGQAYYLEYRKSRNPDALAHGLATFAIKHAPEDSFWNCITEKEQDHKAHQFIKSIQLTYHLQQDIK